MLKQVVSSVLITALLAGSVSLVPASAAENNKASDTSEIKTITVGIKDDVKTYYDENGNDVNPTKSNSPLRLKTNLPSSYDLRDYGRSTSVKNQGSEGLCWAFASTASVESSILTKGLSKETADTLDLSEGGNSWYIHTNTTDTSSPLYNEYMHDIKKGGKGGLSIYVADSLSSGYGTYPESMLKYEDYMINDYPEDYRFYSDYRLKDYNEFDVTNVDLVKQRIMDVGAAYYAFNCFMVNYYHTEYGMETYYDNGTSVNGDTRPTPHAVTIIGWDDNFSKENFNPKMQPENDGAWLCKNSWGEGPAVGDDNFVPDEEYTGYFWVSYETDASEISQFEMQSTDKLDNIYQHQVEGRSFLEVDSAANIFTAKSEEELEQVCFGNTGAVDVNISIYKLNKDYASPIDGKLLSSFDTSVAYTGTHMIDCPEDIMLSEGDVFSVVIDVASKENDMGYIKYKAENNYSTEATGKSFFTLEDGKWIDVAEYKGDRDKAYDKDYEEKEYVSYMAIKVYTSNPKVDKSKLTELVDKSNSIAYDKNIKQADFDKFKEAVNSAENVLADENMSQTAVNNAYCILNKEFKTISNYCCYINSSDEFLKYYDDVCNGKADYKYVELNADIDLSDYVFTESMYTEEKFTGEFNGNGYTISNFKFIAESLFEYGGLFANAENAIFKNVTFENAYLEDGNGTGIIAGISRETDFINCNVKNSKVRISGINAALFSASAMRSTFTDCTVEDCLVSSDSAAGVFATDEEIHIDNCRVTNCTVFATEKVYDSNGLLYECYSNDMDAKPIIKLTNDKCTIEPFIGPIESVELNGVKILATDGVYCIDKDESNDSVMSDITFGEFEKNEDYFFSCYSDTKEIVLSGYRKNDTDIVIPSVLYGHTVAYIQGRFDKVASITLPKTIKSITEKTLGYTYTDNAIMPIEGFVIKGYAGTAAEEYAKANGFTFVDLTASMSVGDVNLDGTIDVNDVTYLQMHLAGYKNSDGSAMIDTTDEDMFKITDANADNDIDVNDVSYIQMMIAGLI